MTPARQRLAAIEAAMLRTIEGLEALPVGAQLAALIAVGEAVVLRPEMGSIAREMGAVQAALRDLEQAIARMAQAEGAQPC